MAWPHVVSGDVGGGPLLSRIVHFSLMFYCSTKVWFVPCGLQFPWRLSEINGIALYWLNIIKPRYFYVTEGGQHIGTVSSPLCPSHLIRQDPHYTLSTFQDGSPKLNKPSETLSKYWDQLRDESWCAKLSYWHDFQDRVWAKYFPPLHRSWGWLLAPLSCLPAKCGAFSRGPPQGPIHLYLSFLSEQMKLESFNNVTPLCH